MQFIESDSQTRVVEYFSVPSRLKIDRCIPRAQEFQPQIWRSSRCHCGKKQIYLRGLRNRVCDEKKRSDSTCRLVLSEVHLTRVSLCHEARIMPQPSVAGISVSFTDRRWSSVTGSTGKILTHRQTDCGAEKKVRVLRGWERAGEKEHVLLMWTDF